MEHFPVSSAFLGLFRTRDMKFQKSCREIVKRISYYYCYQLSHKSTHLCKNERDVVRSQTLFHVWCVKMNFISNKSLNHGTFSCFKHFFKNSPSGNRQKNRLSDMTNKTLPPFSLIRDFGKQNTHGNVSKISVSLACYRQIGSKSTNHSPLA